MGGDGAPTTGGRLRSLRCASSGIAVMLRSQPNAWMHAAATVAVCVVGFVPGLSTSEWCWIVLAIVAVEVPAVALTF